MPARIVVTEGTIYGSWTLLWETAPDKQNRRRMMCRCACGQLGSVRLTHLRNGKSQSCGTKGCPTRAQGKREESTNWKGGRREEDGYVLVYLPDHPRTKGNGYVREHTVVMETFLGRYLLDHESVHHKNGQRNDNRIENLELWSTSQPYGQRVQDKLAWAYEIIQLYGGSL